MTAPRRTMTAVRAHGPGDLRVERVPLPSLVAGDVLLRVRAVGVCATDRKIAARGPHGGAPRVLGHEIVGEVVPGAGDQGASEPAAVPADERAAGDPGAARRRVAVAPNVGEGTCRWCASGATNYCPEFRAFGIHLDGGMAEYMVVPRRAVEAGHLLDLPEALDDERAALLEPLACCVEGLLASALAPGETLLIVGGGVMGRLHVAAGRALGAGRIVLLDRDAGRLEHARALGADIAIRADDEDAERRARDATDGGADVVAVTVGNAEVVSQALGWLATGGRLNVFAGVPGGARVTLDPNDVHYRRLSLLGTTGASLPTLRRTLGLLAAGRLRLDGMVSGTYPLEEASRAFEAAGRPEHARVLLIPRPGGTA